MFLFSTEDFPETILKGKSLMKRRKMMKEDLANTWRSAKVADEKAVQAFLKVPRELFVLEELKEVAYEDCPLPIPCGKTISQPTTTIIMINALELKEGDKILEVGTGSGYHAALMATVIGSGKVISLEVVPELVAFARANLKKAGITNVIVIEEDGSQGYEKEAPYDKIIITAACPEVPKPLLEQLKNRGILVAPVGPLHEQVMVKMRKKSAAEFEMETLGGFMFLPMVGKHGFREEELD